MTQQKKGKTENELVTFRWYEHSYGKAKDLPDAQALMHFWKSNLKIRQGWTEEGSLLLALQMGESSFPFSLMSDRIPRLAAFLDPLLAVYAPGAVKQPCCHSSVRENRIKEIAHTDCSILQ